ncbi:Endonuclease/Exonuclease/phosphatase family protein [Gimesia fumaroli]|uniref:Endonuclease/Exonuclease/phosphatase family protein n=2 Tax=Gimesia fumaroli TaxID=2527976 RepID=A0A518ICK4_9PLAN|nr:Endonuclease/Exonuclease/phosphatase family protein [Gimesia fumaroli]
MKNKFFLLAYCVFLAFWTSSVFADQPITVATWNVGFMDRNVTDLKIDDFLNEVDFDILLVNEIKTQDDLNSLKAAMDREDFHTAISSFTNGNGNLEVGIISRFPLTEIVEYDRSIDNSGNITEKKLERVNLPGIANVGVGRGFLVAKVQSLNLYVIVSHLKSSKGRSGQHDRSNAQKRELVAAAIATHTLELREDHPECSVLFGGDVNVGVADKKKNGVNLIVDNNDGTNTGVDGYDETHAILGGGLIDSLKMRSLAEKVKGTFVGNDNIPDYPGTGAIDVLYITGPLESKFKPAVSATDRHGSDHLCVYSSTGSVTPDGPNLPTENSVEITNALPNPDGDDNGNESITITYSENGTVDISGWTMQDRAGNIFKFKNGTKLNSGENEIVLSPHTMPLNNSGDTIILMDKSSVQRGPVFSYSRQEVKSGQRVR